MLPNCVYALHDYSMMGFPTGERYKGTSEQNTQLERQFKRKAAFMTSHGTPIWNGEFGPVYANPRLEADAEAVNADRYRLLAQQLSIYDKYQIHWSIWLYKDIGLQGMVHTAPDSAWNTLLAPFLEKKRRLQLDAWGKYPSAEAEAALKPLVEWIDRVAPSAKEQYPTPWATERQMLRQAFQTFVANSLSSEFAELFRGKSLQELDQLARSFAFEECVQREGLNRVLHEHAKVRGGGGGQREKIVLDKEDEGDMSAQKLP